MNNSDPQVIIERAQLVRVAADLGVRPDWHEPDEQGVTARVEGLNFDNAGFWPTDAHPFTAPELIEMHVIINRYGRPVAVVNLATLLAWASRANIDHSADTELFWRQKIASEVREHAGAVRTSTHTPSVGFALAALIDHVAERVADPAHHRSSDTSKS